MRFRQMIVTRRADLKNRQQQDEQHMPQKQGDICQQMPMQSSQSGSKMIRETKAFP